MIKVIVFDMDDTLYPEKDYVKSGFSTVSKYLEKQGIYGFYQESWRLFNEGERGNIFNLTLDNLQVEYDEEYIVELLSVYRSHEPNISLQTVTIEMLERLKREFKLGLITDGYLLVQENKVNSLNLKKWIDYIICTDALGRENWKPSKVPFVKMMGKYKYHPENYIYIGDNPLKDFIAPNQLGWTTIHLLKKDGIYSDVEIDEENKAQYSISSLNELDNILKQLVESIS